MYELLRFKVFVICTVAIAALSLFTVIAGAETITQEAAKEAARSFLLKEQTSPPRVVTKVEGEFTIGNQAIGLSLGEIMPLTDGDGEVVAFVQNLEPQGFIIMSADDNIRSVLGFSFVSNFVFDGGRANPLFDLVVADVHARKRLGQIESYESSVSELLTQWGPWLLTTWYQSGHYNDKCPYLVKYVPGVRRLVGCVATATAQILNYWQYPKAMRFSDDDYFSISGTPYTLDGAGSWGVPTLAEMNLGLASLLYNGSEDEEAYLSFATGVKLHMDYGITGSGANTYFVRDVLNGSLGFGSAKAYTDPAGVWSPHRDEIIEDLMNGWPVQIAIHKSGESGGHSIVVDGYRDAYGYFHLNYGWGENLPDPISTAWYNIPTNMPGYDVVHTVVYGIAKYFGWSQIGADQRNSYHAVYPAPISEPFEKWPVNIPDELTPISTSYSFDHLVVGKGQKIYASLSPSDLGSVYHPYIAIYNKFGTLEKLIEVMHSNDGIPFLSQGPTGEIYFYSDQSGPSAVDAKVYSLDPETEAITEIFTHNSPDAGIAERPITVDRDNRLYFVIQPRLAINYARFYCITGRGTPIWGYSFPSSAQFYMTIPAVDEDRGQVYLNYYNSSTSKSHLIAFSRANGSVLFDRELPTATHYSSKMASAPAVGSDGTVYVDADDVLFALDPNDGNIGWQRTFSWRGSNPIPSIGNNGTLYVTYNDKVSSLNPATGATIWEKPYSLGSTEYLGEIYSAANQMVVISFEQGGVFKLGGLKDEGSYYNENWEMIGGGTLAFGPSRTLYSIPPGWGNSILALTDCGEYKDGDPEGGGMDYADNEEPDSTQAVSPLDGSEGMDTASVVLSWACSDPDGHGLKYDVYICALTEGEEAAFVPVASQITDNSFTLTHLRDSTEYLWTVVASDGQAFGKGPVWSFTTDFSSDVNENSDVGSLPREFQIHQNYPNPFNPATEINFDLPRRCQVKLEIFNILGQKVTTLVNGSMPAGYHTVTWDGSNSASGIYLYRLQAGDFVESKKMILMK